MQLKQTYSNFYGQIDKEMKGILTKDPDSEKVHQEKDVLTLRKLLKNIHFTYRRSKEPTKTPWQADKDIMKPETTEHGPHHVLGEVQGHEEGC